jgi:phospholipid/cholesterol/gamma-HCH transport system substrate-binding protein
MRTAIRKHLGDFLAVIALFILALGTAAYILSNERLRFPFVEKKPLELKVQLPNAQAVTPGQGQTVRVAGVEVGEIGQVNLEDGKAVVDLEIDPKYKHLIRRDATALLRSKTGVKDMFIEVDPGDGPPLKKGGTIRIDNTAPDINPDEFLSALDTDTRDYLRLLISGAGKGLKGRGSDLQETFARFGPLHRDLAKVSGAVAKRRHNLRHLIHNYGILVRELGSKDRQLTTLVQASNQVFDALASQNTNISQAVAELPGTLRQTQRTLLKLDPFARELGPTLDVLRPALRALEPANRATLPLLREGEPILRTQIRPFTRIATPYFRNLGRAAGHLVKAGPDIDKTFLGLNRLFDIGAYNPGGAQGLTGNLARDRARDEGYLYWLAWTAQNTVSLFSTGDAQGNFRRIYLGGLSCGLIAAATGGVFTGLAPVPPQLAPLLPGITTALGNAGVCAQ